VLVIANSADPASLELAWEYMKGRSIPPANLLRIPFQGNVNISPKEFHRRLVTPLERRLNELPEPVDYVVLMRGVPYRVDKVSVPTALMFRGPGRIRPYHPYYQRQIPFDGSIPMSGVRMQLPTIISGYNYEETRQLIENAREHYPSPGAAGTFFLCTGKGPRGSRAPQIDGAIAALEKLGAVAEKVQGADVRNRLDIIGQFTGAPRLALRGNRYLPGSIIDNMTSFGGYLFDPKGQMSVLTFVKHGACGAYGTVAEPTNSWSRWADFSLPARYASGFNLAESYYQTVRDFTYGLVVGDPLMAPFSQPAAVELAAPATFAPGAKFGVRVRAREGREGEGLSSIEVWLDDMARDLRCTPVLTQGTACTLRVRAG
jgi:uncharacterized protein (TIGR03790 family)